MCYVKDVKVITSHHITDKKATYYCGTMKSRAPRVSYQFGEFARDVAVKE